MSLSFFVLAFAPFIFDSFERKPELRVFHALMNKNNEKAELFSWLTLTFMGYPRFTSAS
jgi:hypothetical protein